MTITEPVPEVDGRLGVVVAELSGEVLRLTRQIESLRADISREVRTARLIVSDGLRSVEITPGRVELEHVRTSEPDSGSYVQLSVLPHGGHVNAGAVFNESNDPQVSVWMSANSESVPTEALLMVATHRDGGPHESDGHRRYVSVAVGQPTGVEAEEDGA